MRIGSNPMKKNNLKTKKGYHRVIIPIHIPNLDGYYIESFEILKICVSSLLQTIHEETLITIINNKSCNSISKYLRTLLEEEKIDQLIEYSENKGKVDPVVSIMRGCLENLITVSDCDVLFKNGWQCSIEHIFTEFPKTGMVSPLPQPQFRYLYTSWSWYAGLKDAKIARIKNQDIESLYIFKNSLGSDAQLSEIEINPYYIIKNKKPIACIGSGHFCATYSRFVIPFIPQKSSGKIFDNAERDFLDAPTEAAGLMRLSTTKGMVFHMGNKIENWMYDVNNENKTFSENTNKIELSNGYFSEILILRKMVKYIFSSTRVKTLINKILIRKSEFEK